MRKEKIRNANGSRGKTTSTLALTTLSVVLLLLLLPCIFSSCASLPVIFDSMDDNEKAIILYNASNDKLSTLDSLIYDKNIVIRSDSGLTVNIKLRTVTEYDENGNMLLSQTETLESVSSGMTSTEEYATVYKDGVLYVRRADSRFRENMPDYEDFEEFLDETTTENSFRVSKCSSLAIEKDSATGLYQMTYSEPSEENIKNIKSDYYSLLGSAVYYSDLTAFNGGVVADRYGFLDSDYLYFSFVGQEGSPYAMQTFDVEITGKVTDKNSDEIKVLAPGDAADYKECKNILAYEKAVSAVNELDSLDAAQFIATRSVRLNAGKYKNMRYNSNTSGKFAFNPETGAPEKFEIDFLNDYNDDCETGTMSYADGKLMMRSSTSEKTKTQEVGESDIRNLIGGYLYYARAVDLYDAQSFTVTENDYGITSVEFTLSDIGVLSAVAEFYNATFTPEDMPPLPDSPYDCTFSVSFNRHGELIESNYVIHSKNASGSGDISLEYNLKLFAMSSSDSDSSSDSGVNS